MKETRKQVRLNRDSARHVKLFKTNKGWMTMGVTTLAMAAGVITLGSNASDVSAATWKSRSVSEITDQIKQSASKTTYTIKWGDTLGTIAQALKNTGINTTAERLAEINHIAKADLIYAGNTLTFTGTGNQAVATVKEDGQTKSYNLDPNKTVEATKTDVDAAKDSQKTPAKAATKTTATTKETKFEAAIKAAGYTFTKSGSEYDFEVAGATDADKSAIDGIAKQYGVTDYAYTVNGVKQAAAKADATEATTDAAKSTDEAADTQTTSALAKFEAALDAKDLDYTENDGVVTVTSHDDVKDTVADLATEAGFDTNNVKVNAVKDLTANDQFEAAIKAKGYTFTMDGTKYAFEVGSANADDVTAITDVLNYYGVTNYEFTTNGKVQATDAQEATTTTKSAAVQTEVQADTAATKTTEKTETVAATKTVTTPAKKTSTATATKTTTKPAATTSTVKKTTTAPKKTVTKPAVSKPTTSKTTTATSSSRDAKVAAVIKTAQAQLGKPYVYGSKGPSSFDCSGLISYVFKQAIGMNMSGNSASQSYKGTKVSLSSLQKGDLIFWSHNGSNTGVYHVAIYIGGGQYIVAPHTGTNVQIQTISSYFKPSFAKRVL